MDMTLSKRGDYVTRAAIALARAFDDGLPHKIREVVAHTEVPATYASQILADLVRAGLATSKAGRDGGYRLARPPRQISVLEVVEAGEGPLRSERCALGDGPCRWEAVCPLHETWTAATDSLRDLLSRTTLAELAARDEAIEAGTYQVPADSHRSHPGSVAVSDGVQVELPEAEVRRALAGYASRAASLVATAGPVPVEGTGATRRRGTRSRPSATVEVSLVSATSSSPDGTGEGRRFLLDWQTAGPERTTRLDGTMSVTDIDPDRSEIRVEATWHQHGKVDALLDETGLEGEARTSLRTFLKDLARSLEQAS